MKILLVEDNPDQALIVERVLRRFNHKWNVTAVDSGASCLARLADESFSVVVLDYSLPGMSGLEVLEQITLRHPHVPVVMVTGQGDEQIAVKAMKGGVADYLVKGDQYLTSLPSVVEKVVEQDRLKQALTESQRRLSDLLQISLDLSMAADLDRAAQILADGARVLTRSGVGLVIFLDPGSGLVERIATSQLTIHENVLQTSIEGRGMLGAPLNASAPVSFAGVHQQPDRNTMPAHSPLIEAAMVLPVIFQHRPAGIVLVGNPDEGAPYRSDQMEVLLNLTLHAASVIANLRSVEEARRQAVTDGLTGLYNHRECQKRLVQEVERAQRYGRGFSIVMIDVDHFKTFNDLYGHQVGDLVLTCVARTIVRQLRQVDIAARYGGEEFLVILPETAGDAGAQVADRICRAVAAEQITLPSDESVFVTVSVGTASFPDDAEAREGLIAAADHALYLAKERGRNGACRYNRDEQMPLVPEPASMAAMLADPTLQAIKDLAAAVDAKSAYTRGHSLEVTQYAMRFAEHLALTDDQKEGLRIAGLLHNLGVVSVPDRILAKPGPLTEEERKVIQAHPGLADLLGQEAPRFKGVAQAILYHHERWDGHGYPRGLKGEEIPRLARILGLVEAYHAMISARPYRRRLTRDEAIEELRSGSGTQFDPFLVDRFIEILGDSISSSLTTPKAA